MTKGRKEGETCGLGVEEYKGKCRSDLECEFTEGEILGTCQVKSKFGCVMNNQLIISSWKIIHLFL